MDSYDVLNSRFRIIVPEDEIRMNAAVIRFIKRSFVREIGLDCEWQNDGPVSLIQIATEYFVILFQVCRFINRRVLPRELASILKDDYYVKVGVNIEEDARRIKHRFDTSVRGWIDLRCYAIGNDLLAEYLLEQLENYESLHCTNNTSPSSVREKRLNFMPKLGLDALVGACLGKSLKGTSQNRFIQVYGNWNSWVLSDEDKVYAAADAASSLDVFHALQRGTRSVILVTKWDFIETPYDHKRMRIDCLGLISSIAPPYIQSILPHYYDRIITTHEAADHGNRDGARENAEVGLLSYVWSVFTFLLSCIFMLLKLFFGLVLVIMVVHLMIEHGVILKTRQLVLKYLDRPNN